MFMLIDALSVSCAQLTRDLLAIAKYLLFLSELRQISTNFNKFWYVHGKLGKIVCCINIFRQTFPHHRMERRFTI